VAGDLEDAAGLHSRRDRKEIGPIERVQLGLCAERGLGNRQVQCREQVRARPLKAAVRLHAEMHVEIPGRPAPQCCCTCADDT